MKLLCGFPLDSARRERSSRPGVLEGAPVDLGAAIPLFLYVNVEVLDIRRKFLDVIRHELL